MNKPMPLVKNEIYAQRHRQVLGSVKKNISASNTHGQLSISSDLKDQLITFNSLGLVVSINGSGSLPLEHRQTQLAVELTEKIIEQGGLIINGGRSSGIMEATARVAGDKCVGLLFPELTKEHSSKGVMCEVNNPHPRVEILATCAPIVVVFRGGLGSLMVLMRAIVHMRNKEYHPQEPPQMLFISNYWIGLLSAMMNLGALPKEFLKEINFFENTEDIISKIPLPKKI